MAYNLRGALDPRAYVLTILALIAVQVILSILVPRFPALDQMSSIVSMAAVILAALASGARLVDAGYRRWIGVTVVVLLGWVLPFGGIIGWMLLYGSGGNGQIPYEVYGAFGLGGSALLVVFFIWTATRPPALPAGRPPGS